VKLPPIAALATAPGVGAIAVIRISGEGAGEIAARVFQPSRTVATPWPARRALHGFLLRPDGSRLDEVLLTRFAAPHSYTGEEVIEISCHGGMLVTTAAVELLLEAGARAAEPGEFTQRAFLHGKLDLTQAEAVMDVITAKTPLALQAAQDQLAGDLGRAMQELREALLAVVAHVEAWIDFPEEDIDTGTREDFRAKLRALADSMHALLSRAHEGRILREGVRVALCGRPNAGKSSLLNRLLGCERAIVSSQPGTTRDTIEEYASIRGVPFRFIDTAGLRSTEDEVEQAGVRRAREAMDSADLLVEVVDATAAPDESLSEAGPARVIVANKMDLLPQLPAHLEDALPVSCLTGAGLEELRLALVRRVGFGYGDGASSLAVINARHQACLQRALEATRRAETALAEALDLELVAVDLRAALQEMGEILGQVDVEEILGKIFSTFCIGK
jgi:tRNA modification GTPase